MSVESLKASLNSYHEQLQKIEMAITTTGDVNEKENLVNLQDDFKQLIELTIESIESLENPQCDAEKQETSDDDPLSSEYALFMTEINQEEQCSAQSSSNKLLKISLDQDLKLLEGMKCRAPHVHNWGDTVYHNAMISSVVSANTEICNDVMVRVLFINPTHQEMLPCPYFLETECKFSEEKCKFSHGEIVKFSSLQEYIEPKFEFLKMGSPVLAKQKTKLWQRATIKKIGTEKCIVKFDFSRNDSELDFHDVLPLDNDEGGVENKYGDKLVNSDNDVEENEDIINMSLLNTPSSQIMGEWEKHTKGIGSKLMEKMGYVIGTGLGRYSNGRLDPISAVILPAGKSLDHCMHLKENAGDDKNLFSVEKRLLRIQKKQELRNQKIYEQEKNKVDVFNFLNDTLSASNSSTSTSFSNNKHRQDIRKESSRDLNVASLKTDEDIKRLERELYKINDSLKRHGDNRSQVYKNLNMKLSQKQNELKNLKAKATNIKNEQSNRNDKKKLTIF